MPCERLTPSHNNIVASNDITDSDIPSVLGRVTTDITTQ